MCTVSNVSDGWRDQFPEKWPQFPQVPFPQPSWPIPGVSQADFDALKREVEALKKLLLAAKKFDEETGQPDCEMDDKVKLIKAVAKMVGVDLGDVFEKPKA